MCGAMNSGRIGLDMLGCPVSMVLSVLGQLVPLVRLLLVLNYQYTICRIMNHDRLCSVMCHVFSGQAPLLPQKHLHVFIEHSQAQSVLALLRLPFMCRDNAPGRAPGTSCVVVDDDEDSRLGGPSHLVNFRGGSGGSDSASVNDCGSVGVDSLNSGSGFDLDLEVQSDSRRAGGSGSGSGSNHGGRSGADGGLARAPLVELDLNLDLNLFQDSDSQGSQNSQQQSQQALVPFDNIENIRRSNSRRWTPTTLKELRRRDYENMPPQQCTYVAFKASAALQQSLLKCQEQAKQIRALKRVNQRQENVIKKKQKVLEEETAKRSNLEIVPIGKTGTRMSVQSAFAIGVRRNLSNIAAADFGATILTDVSQQRVTRSELKTAAALLCRMKSVCSSVVFTGDHVEDEAHDLLGLHEVHPNMEQEWLLSVVSTRCDATNSSIWKREKLHVLDVDFAWVEDFAAVRKFDADKAIRCRRCLFCA